MKFDPTVVETFTRRLYWQATKIVVKSVLTYAFVGWGGSMGAYYYLPAAWAHDYGVPMIVVTTVLCALIGWSVGSDKAFALRLQAQILLCQLQIERNTRAALVVGSASAKANLLSLEATHLAPAASAAAAE